MLRSLLPFLQLVLIFWRKNFLNKMATNGQDEEIHEILPKTGILYTEKAELPVLCKPKILPLKSVTLEKLEKMQKESQEMIKQQEEDAKLQEQLLEQQRLAEEEESGGGQPDVLTL